MEVNHTVLSVQRVSVGTLSLIEINRRLYQRAAHRRIRQIKVVVTMIDVGIPCCRHKLNNDLQFQGGQWGIPYGHLRAG